MVRKGRRRSASRVSPRGSSRAQREGWAAAYADGDYAEKPWFDPEPTRAVVRASDDGFFAPTTRILDIGCGAGSNVLYLARRGYEAHGVDLAPGAVQAARRRAEDEGLLVEVVEGDALDLPFARGRFDAALDHGCFHTLPIRRRDDYVREVARVVRPGGHFLLAWVAREYTASLGPPHRPSVAEVSAAFEPSFQILSTMYRGGSEEDGLPSYVGRLERRTAPQPARR